MSTLTIKELPRNEELDRKTMAEVRGGIIGGPSYHAGMTVGEAIEQFVKYANDLHDYYSGK